MYWLVYRKGGERVCRKGGEWVDRKGGMVGHVLLAGV